MTPRPEHGHGADDGFAPAAHRFDEEAFEVYNRGIDRAVLANRERAKREAR